MLIYTKYLKLCSKSFKKMFQFISWEDAMQILYSVCHWHFVNCLNWNIHSAQEVCHYLFHRNQTFLAIPGCHQQPEKQNYNGYSKRHITWILFKHLSNTILRNKKWKVHQNINMKDKYFNEYNKIKWSNN